MKKNIIFLGAAAFVLSIAAFVSKKEGTKFVTVKTCVTAAGNVSVKLTTLSFTTVANGDPAFLCTAGGTFFISLFTKVNRTKRCYCK